MTTMTIRFPDDLTPAIKDCAQAAGLSVNAYVVRAARRSATLDAGRQLAALGLGDDLAGEGDTL
ncbi:toxin-antitoxin system HicB family antitoxin [Streptomyces sp. NPDC101152]|uniref:toxin-antitoxin system HicB family antitoxin n=1 Tax=Streptomyces sp. NPDC101152 TaxID=3366116 RepID=UPI00381F301B